MADQASLNHGRRLGEQGPAGMVGSLAEFGYDVATLAELQAKLALVELKQATQRAVLPTIALIGSVVFGLAALPILLLGIAELIAARQGIPIFWALLLTAGATLVLAAAISWVAWIRFNKSFEALRASREELARNLSWIKTVLAQSGRFTPRTMD